MQIGRKLLSLIPSVSRCIAGISIGAAVIIGGGAFISLFPSQAHAAQTIPYKMNFQGRLTDNAGNIKPDGFYNVKFRIYDAASAGTLQWSEDRVFGTPDTRIEVKNGLFSVQLGDATTLPISIFTNQNLYFEIELPTPGTATCATAGCASFTEGPMGPRQKLAASAYAMNADTVDGIDGSSLARNDAANTFSGAQLIRTASASALQVQNTANAAVLTTDTSNNQVVLGQASTLAGKLLVANASNANTVTLVSGVTTASYQLTLPTALGVSGDCLKDTDGTGVLGFGSCGAGGSTTLQQAYDASGTTNPQITLSSTNGGIKIRDGSTAVSGNLLQIQNNAGTDNYFSVAANGATFSNGPEDNRLYFNPGKYWDPDALVMQSAAGYFNIDMGLTKTVNFSDNVTFTGGNVGIGTIAPTTAFHAAVNNTQVVVPMAKLQQAGTGDVTLEFNDSNTNNSFYLGQDTSNASGFVINSRTAATGGKTFADIAHVQTVRGANTGSTAVTSISRAFGTNNAAGNLIVAYFTLDTTNTTTFTCSDSQANTYATAVTRHDTAKVQLAGICYAMNSKAGANTVTITFGASSSFADLSAHEYSGVATTNALDVTASNIASGSTATNNVTTTGATTTLDKSLVFGAVRATSNLSTTDYTAGTGFTGRDNATSFPGTYIEDRVQTTAGSIAATFTADVSSTYIAAMATFKPQETTGAVTDTYANPLFRLSQAGALILQNSTNSTEAFAVRTAAGTGLLFADTTNSAVSIGSTVSDSTAVVLRLDSYNVASDPAGVDGAMYYNSAMAKFRCFEGGAWKNCISATTGTSSTFFEDVTAAAWADAQTTELFNDTTKPNITTPSAQTNVTVSLQITGLSDTIADTFLAARIVYTTDGTNPSCSTSPQVGRSMIGGFTTSTSHPYSVVGTFTHNPGIAGNVKYTVCTSDESVGTVSDTPDNVTISLVTSN